MEKFEESCQHKSCNLESYEHLMPTERTCLIYVGLRFVPQCVVNLSSCSEYAKILVLF